MPDNTPTNSAQPYTTLFATTHWSVVRAAGQTSSPHYKEALGTLYRTYWFPLYAFLRRQGHNSHQAEEYTQAFFTQLLEKRGLRPAYPIPKSCHYQQSRDDPIKHITLTESNKTPAKHVIQRIFTILFLLNKKNTTRAIIPYRNHWTD